MSKYGHYLVELLYGTGRYLLYLPTASKLDRYRTATDIVRNLHMIIMNIADPALAKNKLTTIKKS